MIKVKNFDKQTIASTNDIKSAFSLIPKRHVKGIDTVIFDPNRFFQRSYVSGVMHNNNVQGQYNQNPKNYIAIYDFQSISKFQHVLFHEIGHHVFENHLSPVQRKYWIFELFKSANYISEYARTNAHEDFAECYAFYFHSKNKLSRYHKKYAFIRKLVI